VINGRRHRFPALPAPTLPTPALPAVVAAGAFFFALLVLLYSIAVRMRFCSADTLTLSPSKKSIARR
jgi:hypothetical protein